MKRVRLKADIILNMLTKKNLSQNSLARRLGISSAYISQLLSGKRTVSPKLREKMLDELKGWEFDDLFEIQDRA